MMKKMYSKDLILSGHWNSARIRINRPKGVILELTDACSRTFQRVLVNIKV